LIKLANQRFQNTGIPITGFMGLLEAKAGCLWKTIHANLSVVAGSLQDFKKKIFSYGKE
jgi:hypothetical protein